MINKNKQFEIEREDALEKIREANRKKASEKRGKKLIKENFEYIKENFANEDELFI
jgi:hypothetical protein